MVSACAAPAVWTPLPVTTSLVATPGVNVTVWVFVRLEPSSFALTVTLCAVVEDVRGAVYVPSPLSVVAQFDVQAPGNVPSVVESVPTPPLKARFVPAEFLSCTVMVDVDTLLAVIDVGAAPTVDCTSAAGAVLVTACAPKVASRFAALSWALFAPGCV